MVQRELNYAIVDEVDSILIDEARTPLIISGQGEESSEMYQQADRFVRKLTRGEDIKDISKSDQLMGIEQEDSGDYMCDIRRRTVQLTAQGIEKAQSFFHVENLSDTENTELNHYIKQALRAHSLFTRDKDYVVQDGQVLIVDEFTGRLMIGRRYNEGLHQALEAKEGVKVERENKTLATITFQNYFRMFRKLAGMTGTAKTEEDEFTTIYGLDVVEVPTNKPCIRQDMPDMVYTTESGKFKAVVSEIVEVHKTGRPLLVGTISVEKSEFLSDKLSRAGIPHQVLNAKFHAKEAQIVAQAGKLNAVTIATNMAGRGTDILLGGNPDFLARQALMRDGLEDDLIEEATGHAETEDEKILSARQKYKEYYTAFKAETDQEHEQVVALGGLHIIGTERHESRRIDNQLRGRAGRQGDPGSTRFYVSLQDELMRRFGADRMEGIMARLNPGDEIPIENSLITKQIEGAQKRVEMTGAHGHGHARQLPGHDRRHGGQHRQRLLPQGGPQRRLEPLFGQQGDLRPLRRPNNGHLRRIRQETALPEGRGGGLPGVHRSAAGREGEGAQGGGHRPARGGTGGPASDRGHPLDGPHRRHGPASPGHRPSGLRPEGPGGGLHQRGL